MLDSLVRQLKIRRFANNFITIPCLVISVTMLFIQPNILWTALTGFNIFTIGINRLLIRILKRQILSIEAEEEANRKQKVEELYGR